jgi:hypothetical protein
MCKEPAQAQGLRINLMLFDGWVSDVKSEASRHVIPHSDESMSFIARWLKVAPDSKEGWMFEHRHPLSRLLLV